MAGESNLIIYAGQGLDATTCQWRWLIKETHLDPGTPVDLTGYTARAMIRSTLTQVGAPLATWTTENGKIFLGGVAGTFGLSVGDLETSALWSSALAPHGTVNGRAAFLLGHWDFELVPPTAAVRRLLQGLAIIVPEVTRP